MSKCVAYCRVSTDSDEQLNSLGNQIKHYTNLFNQNGYEPAECGMYYSKEGKREIVKYIPSIFADEGISGTKLKNREAFKYMIECANRREFDIIFVKNIARWARSVEDGAGILKRLKVMGIKVIFEDGNINNFDHEMVINVLLSTSQEESRAKSVAVQFGIRKAQQTGKFTSAIPYGYYSEKGYLRPLDKELSVVKTIYDLYLNKDWGATKIARHLNHENIPTKKGKKWTHIQIYKILSNSIYTGKQITHTVMNTDVNKDIVEYYDEKENKLYRFKSIKPVDESEWIVTYREDLKIITESDFNSVQQEMIRRKEISKIGHRPSVKHPFSNLLYCHSCNKALRRKKLCTWDRKNGGKTLKYEWVCNMHDRYHNDICKYRNSWEESKLLGVVRKEIEKLRNNPKKLDNMLQKYLETFCSEKGSIKEIEDLKISLQQIDDEYMANLTLYAKKFLDDEQFRKQNDALQKREREAKTRLNTLSRINNEILNVKKQYGEYKDFLNGLDLQNLTNSNLRKVFSRIEAYTYTNKEGKEVKKLHFVLKFYDKSTDDILMKLTNLLECQEKNCK